MEFIERHVYENGWLRDYVLRHAITHTTTSVTIICIIYLSEKQNKLSNSRKQKQGLQQVISVVETANVGNFAPFLASKL